MNYATIEEALRTDSSVSEAMAKAISKAVQVASMKDQAVSCRVQIGRYFRLNGNKAVHYKQLAAAIGRDPLYVAQILSGHYEFRNTKPWSGRWKMRADWLKKVN
jgi:hypothetical protein